MTKKLTGKTLTGISRSLASLPKTPLDTLRPVSLCRTYALIPRPSPQGLRSADARHTIMLDREFREVGIVFNRSCSPAADGVREWQRTIQDMVPVSRAHLRAKGKR
ncbi:hypothetical protein [Reyranella sp.]|uniref:hypothetical protein n=1 Tax=Reyranella sp. TaxID=1929291 RepID=UPI0025F678AA|nr:hypothetical protein [Reyranella sp.]